MKKKYHFLPFNLFWCLPNLFCTYIILTTLHLFTDHQALTIGLIMYLIDIKHSTDRDYLVDQLNEKKEKFS